MLDDFVDRLIGRLMAGAGLIVAAAIAAVAAAMAIFAFLAAWVGAAWAYAIVAASAALVVAVWSLLQQSHRKKARKPALDARILEILYAKPPAAFLAGLAAASLARGKPGEALDLWKARKAAARPPAR